MAIYSMFTGRLKLSRLLYQQKNINSGPRRLPSGKNKGGYCLFFLYTYREHQLHSRARRITSMFTHVGLPEVKWGFEGCKQPKQQKGGPSSLPWQCRDGHSYYETGAIKKKVFRIHPLDLKYRKQKPQVEFAQHCPLTVRSVKGQLKEFRLLFL